VNLRVQLERTTGSMVAAGRAAAPAPASRLLALAGGACALALLATFSLGAAQAAPRAGMLAGAVASNLLLVAGMSVVVRQLRPDVFDDARALSLLALLAGVTLAVAAIAARVVPGSPELVPVAFVAIVLSALFDRRLGLLVVCCVGVLVAVQPAYRDADALPVMLAAGATAALVVRPVGRRDQSYLWMVVTATAVALALLVTGAAQGGPRAEVLSSIVRGVGATVAGVIAAVLALPFAERWTGRETHLTLLEWGDLNRPLLQRLSLEAPGTYAHTIAIANLAEAACRAIGANAVLARVGAYYHDIGKLAKPQYFVENQPRGRNLHDKLKPHTSASIIRNHVREGLELADAERMPRSIRAFITEHHGTGTIAFFLEKARERDGVVANTAEYSYPGPVPQSVETAVVMLADGAEAATRALTDPTPERIREVIDAVVRQRLEQGQLRDAPLTLRQLTIVKQQFARVLGGMYHARVDYPTPPVGLEVVRP
jgi:putative nucleotidyltransferase with HDIG domain